MIFYAISDRRRMGPDPRAAVRRLSERYGARLWLQLREPDLSARALLELGLTFAEALGPSAGRLLINDRADVARALDAGLHLPERGLPVAQARRLLPPGAPLGASRHSAEGAAAAARDGADLVTVGPVFASPGKGPPIGLLGLAEACRAAKRARPSCRVIALGGLSFEHEGAVEGAGADGWAAIRAAWADALTPG